MLSPLVLGIAVVAVLGTGAAVAATHVRWSGGLGGPYGNAVGVPVRVGAPFSIGMAQLHRNRHVRIERVRRHHPTPGVTLVGALVHRVGGGVGAEERFPPTYPRVRWRAANGAVIPAHRTVGLVVGLRVSRRGLFRVHGVDVLYRERWHGIDVQRQAHTGLEVDICALQTSARIVDCRAPQPIDH